MKAVLEPLAVDEVFRREFRANKDSILNQLELDPAERAALADLDVDQFVASFSTLEFVVNGEFKTVIIKD